MCFVIFSVAGWDGLVLQPVDREAYTLLVDEA
jgi:hypothetical protein